MLGILGVRWEYTLYGMPHHHRGSWTKRLTHWHKENWETQRNPIQHWRNSHLRSGSNHWPWVPTVWHLHSTLTQPNKIIPQTWLVHPMLVICPSLVRNPSWFQEITSYTWELWYTINVHVCMYWRYFFPANHNNHNQALVSVFWCMYKRADSAFRHLC